MLEDLYRQLDEADRQVRSSQQRVGRLGEVHQKISGLVGRGESEDGYVVVESTSQDPLHSLTIAPRAMRMSSDDLAEAIRDTLAAAMADLREATTAALAQLGISPAHQLDNAEKLRAQLDRSRAEFDRTARTAAHRLEELARQRRGRSS